MAKIYIDDTGYEVEKGKSLLSTCLSIGLDVPYFCWHPAMGSVGACRQCAVVKYKDEDDDKGKIVMSCMEPVDDGLRISVEAPEARQFRRHIIESLMANHPHDCPTCDEGGECHLQDMTVMTGHTYRRYRFNKRTHRNQDLGPFINHEMNRCIQCYRCVRFYKEYAGGEDLDVFAAHDHVYFGRHEEGTLQSEFSGNLAEVCPTGVFTDKTLKKHYTRKWDLSSAPSVCHQCSLGCNIIAGERYGKLRRIRTRYNGEVNGYFLCDRGRFGYEFVNGDDRLLLGLLGCNGEREAARPEACIEAAAGWIREAGDKVIGIGSPRASLESNYALQRLVGKGQFFTGMSKADHDLSMKAVNLLRKLPVKTPSLKEIEQSDAVVVLGEDLLNTAPMMGLALRQSVRQKHFEIASQVDIPEWNDHAVREAAQDRRSPLFLLTPDATKLEGIAALSRRDHPVNIARLGMAVASAIAEEAPSAQDLSEEEAGVADRVAEALRKAERPLIITGTSLREASLLEAAANIALALHQEGKAPRLSFVLQEANSAGLALLGGRSLGEIGEAEATVAVVLENDLFRRAPKKQVEALLGKVPKVIVLDHTKTATTDRADLVLPAGAFAESTGTLVNQEGRAQRFYKAYSPPPDILESWRWLGLVGEAAGRSPTEAYPSLAAITSALQADHEIFRRIDTLTPPTGFRKTGQRIPREPHRYSGRTAMHADETLQEPAPPDDEDAPLSFSMEGFKGEPPSALIPFFWSPGWNSVQSVNKYQIEVGGALHDGDPGLRLLEGAGEQEGYFKNIPASWKAEKGRWAMVPLHHIFGSEATSARGPAIRARTPGFYVALSPASAEKLEVTGGEKLRISWSGGEQEAPLEIRSSLPPGVVGLPAGLPGGPHMEETDFLDIQKSGP